MHPQQYEAYKSGEAKKVFLADLEKRKTPKIESTATPSAPPEKQLPKEINIDVNGEKFNVKISYPGSQKTQIGSGTSSSSAPVAPQEILPANGQYQYISAPIEGKFYLTKESSESPVKVGDVIKEGDTVAYIEAMKVINAITADKSGTVVEILISHGSDIDEDDQIIKLA